MTKMLIAAALAAAFIACGPPPEPQPGPPPIPPDPAPACERAGERLRELLCLLPNGQRAWETPEGVPFADACETAMADGRHWHPECLATIADCSELEAAFRGEVCR